MNATQDRLMPAANPPGFEPVGHGEFLVSHGKSGAFGRFIPAFPLSLRRGDRVVVESQRGLELGCVLCPASDQHARFLGNITVGRLIRPAEPADEKAQEARQDLARNIFEDGRHLAASLALPLEILDVEVLLDGATAILHFLGRSTDNSAALVEPLQQRHRVVVQMENLALPEAAEPSEHGGCGKPDCGKSSGGCSSCGSGGGCSSCGSAKVDMAAYFAHLRVQMEGRTRTSLL